MFSATTALIAIAAFRLALAATTFNVTVGGPGGVVKFSPDFVTADVGDTVLFTFQQKNHSVTQSSLADPCNPLAGGFDSGFQPVSANNTDGPFPQAQFVIQNTDPVWVFCRQTGHCQEGMVFAINPGSNFAKFQATATGNSTSSSSSSSASSSATTAAPSSIGSSSSTSSSASAQTTVAGESSAISTATATVTSGSQTFTTTYGSFPGSSAPTSVTSNNHVITVGGSAGEVYSPSNITAQPGDTVTFQFQVKNHTATQSSFAVPCRELGATSTNGQVGFDSGFMPVAANASSFPTFTIQINDTAPVWVYCRQTGHCGSGMVFSVNAVESGANNFEAFKNNAITQNGTATAAKSASSSSQTSSAVSNSGARSVGIAGSTLAGLFFAFALLA